MQHILTCVVILVAACLLVKACLSIRPPNRRSALEVVPRLNSLPPTTLCQSFSGPIISSKHKDLVIKFSHQDTILYQDNQSAILLEKNGCKPSSKRAKHLNCCFYFITDELSVEYCPTEEMVGDFYTKPLQGKLFYKFRKLIMNLQDSHLSSRLIPGVCSTITSILYFRYSLIPNSTFLHRHPRSHFQS